MTILRDMFRDFWRAVRRGIWFVVGLVIVAAAFAVALVAG